MNWRNFTRGLSLSTLIFGGLLLGLTIFASPDQGPATIVIYYISLFFFLMGLSALTLFLYRKWWTHNEIIYANVKTSIRQGFLMAAFICSILALSSMQLLTWWDASIMAVSFLLIELFFKVRS